MPSPPPAEAHRPPLIPAPPGFTFGGLVLAPTAHSSSELPPEPQPTKPEAPTTERRKALRSISIGSHKAHIATMQPKSGAAGRPENAHFSSSTSGSIRLHIWWAGTCRHPHRTPQAAKPNPSPPNLQPNYWNDSAQGEGEVKPGGAARQSQAPGHSQVQCLHGHVVVGHEGGNPGEHVFH